MFTIFTAFTVLEWLFQGLKFIVVPSVFEENLDKSQFSHPKDYVLENAKQKALEVTNRMIKDNNVRFISPTKNMYSKT